MNNHRISLIFLSFIFLLFTTCSKKETRVVRGYYYWRTNGYVTQEESKFLQTHSITKLYSKLMDIDWSDVNGAYPVVSGKLDLLNYYINNRDFLNIDIVPVIFITNNTFSKIDSSDIELLAKRTIRRCLPQYDEIDVRYEKRLRNEDYWGSDSIPITPKEIQFDCDWTESTAKKYFYFLKVFKSLLPQNIKVSATIRLHQFKYQTKTGVPPVDRGMLMVYNISNPTDYSLNNSIFDLKKAEKYFVSGNKYPLPMDIVLPAFSWCIIFRDKKFYQIENELTEDEIKNLSFLKVEQNHIYKVMTDTVFRDLFLRPGDEIKVETISQKTLLNAAFLAQKAINADTSSIALFELSETEIKNYKYETIESVYSSFSK